MVRRDDPTEILDRIAENRYTSEDLNRLRRLVTVHGDGNVVQVGRYNVRLDQARDIHLGDRIYRGLDAETIRDVLLTVVADAGIGSQIGRGSLRGLSGFIMTVATLIALVGMGMFFYGLIWAMGSPGISSGPPPVLPAGLAIGVIGVLTYMLGQIVRGWERPRRGR